MRAQVVLLQGDRLLLARHDRPDGSYWVLPGGSVEDRESPEQAAVREVAEETGLDIRLERLLFIDGPVISDGVVVRHARYTYLGAITGGQLSQIADPDGGHPGNGYLAGAEWMPWDSRYYDEATRQTLRLVAGALSEVQSRPRVGDDASDLAAHAVDTARQPG